MFAKEIVRKVSHNNKQRAPTPLSSQEKLVKNDNQATSRVIKGYQTIIGVLMYLMLGTRPDLSYAVSKLSRFSSNPSDEHIGAVFRVTDYVNSTTNLCLKYS